MWSIGVVWFSPVNKGILFRVAIGMIFWALRARGILPVKLKRVYFLVVPL